MIEVFDYIKDLLKRDNVLKNFRVTFPDGDRADITNDQLIKESMKFEENIVSRVPVKFGLCEANIISFQCIGVENIKRKRIHVQLELDVSSLTAAQQQECGAKTSSDVPFPYYVIHYGDFVVTESERDNELGIRKIVGTSRGLLSTDEFAYAMNNACWYDKRKLGYFTYSSSKTTDYFNLTNYIFLQGQGIFKVSDVGGEYRDISENVVRGTWGVQAPNDYNVLVKPKNPAEHAYVNESGYCLLSVYTAIYAYETTLTGPAGDEPLFEVDDLNMLVTEASFKESADEAWANFLNIMESKYDLDTFISPTTHQRTWESIKNFIYNIFYGMLLKQYWDAPNMVTNPTRTTYSDEYNPATSKFLPMNAYLMAYNEDISIPQRVYVHICEFTTNPQAADPDYEYVFYGEVKRSSDHENEYHKLYTFTSNNVTLFPTNYMTVTTQQVKIGSATRYTPALPIINISVKNTLQDMLELRGKFGGLGRYGEFKEYSLLEYTHLFPDEDIYPSDTLYPGAENNSVSVRTGEFISATYDEYVFYYKGIYVKYKDPNNIDAEYMILFDEEDDNPDMPYYNVSNNSFITKGKFTEAQIIALIAPLVEILRRFRYYQSDVSMRALPYIEAGDTLFLRTRNDTIVTPTLRHTISGIQDLRDKIVSR